MVLFKAKLRYLSGGAGCLIMCLWLEKKWGGACERVQGLEAACGGASLVSECGRGGWVLERCGGMWGIDCFRICWGMLLVSGRLGGRMEGCGLGEGAAFVLVVEGLGGSG